MAPEFYWINFKAGGREYSMEIRTAEPVDRGAQIERVQNDLALRLGTRNAVVRTLTHLRSEPGERG